MSKNDTKGGTKTYTGTDGNDTVAGSQNYHNVFNHFGLGSDNLTGGNQDDVFHLLVDRKLDKVDGGVGIDTVDYSGADRSLTIDLAHGQTTALFGVKNWFFTDLVECVTTKLSHIENVVGTRFNDTIVGDHKDNVIEGGGGADFIIGGRGSDTASYKNSAAGVHVDLSGYEFFGSGVAHGFGRGGDAEGDILMEVENLIGSGYNDRLAGDRHNNVFTGGDGQDTFVFKGLIGHDTITDFDAKGHDHDVIELSKDLFGDFGSFKEFKKHYLFDTGDDVEIRIDGHNTITLLDVKLSDLDSSDFCFV